jgi:hypothetical protein
MAMVLLTGTRKGESTAVNADRVTWMTEKQAARRPQVIICFEKGNTVVVQGPMAEVIAALNRATAT